MIEALKRKEKSISVTGLGYVGLPLALAFARHFRVIAYDSNQERIALMLQGIDPSGEMDNILFEGIDILFSSDATDLRRAHFHIISVPTDIDHHKVPDLSALFSASESVGKALKQGDMVVYESTVYPGCTEEDCLPILEKVSGLSGGEDFKYGYSPERINPGDKERTLADITKIVSGCDLACSDMIAQIYSHIILKGIYKAPSIKVAEAAKLIENIQRDLNISLMNELAIIFDKMDIDTAEVIEAASTKWNFHKYTPGLVGGHCISVDPFYLLHKAQQFGHQAQVIASGRRVNDYVPHFIAKRLVQTLIEIGKNPGQCRVLVMGITFKENVSDIRNSKVVDLIRELEGYSIVVDIVDPHTTASEVFKVYGLALHEKPAGVYDAIVIAVGHKEFKKISIAELEALSKDQLVLFDIKGIKSGDGIKYYWRL